MYVDEMTDSVKMQQLLQVKEEKSKSSIMKNMVLFLKLLKGHLRIKK